MGATKSRRKRIVKGVYRDRYGLSATVKVGTGSNARQREERFAFETAERHQVVARRHIWRVRSAGRPTLRVAPSQTTPQAI